MKHNKTILFGAAFCGCAMCGAATLLPGKTEVVIAPDAPKTVRFAATEMTNLLSQVLGAAVPLACSSENCTHEGDASPRGRISAKCAAQETTSIILGDNAWSRAAGLDVAQLARDGFWTKAEGNNIYIAGRDDATFDLARTIANGRLDGPLGACIKHCGEHATLFGVYDFLEKYAGARFYFAHPLGTILPRRDKIEVPPGTYRTEPKWTVRNVYLVGDGVWPGETDPKKDRMPPKCLDWLRLRMASRCVVVCHGFNDFQFSRRFGKTHPEWFVLAPNPVTGKLERQVGEGFSANNMCWSNQGVWDQLFSDVMAHWKGLKASEVGIERQWNSGPDGWGPQFSEGSLDISPQDGMKECQCAKCQALYELNRKPSGWCTEFLWSKWAEFARRLAAAGCPYRLRCSGYSGWKEVPKCELPPNIDIEVAGQGPWRWGQESPMRTETEIVRGWAEKAGHKVWMWTYPAKHPDFMFALPGIPDVTPRTWAAYYRYMSQWSQGAFCESQCERSMLHYLNYYVYAKLAWNPDLDLDALLREHYRLMFGAGAAEMAAFYETCEKKWMGEIAGKSIETNLGTEPIAPNRAYIWSRIWGADAIAEAQAHFAKAEKAAAGDAASLARIALMRRELLDPLVAAYAFNTDQLDVKKALARRAARKGVKNMFDDPEFGPTWRRTHKGVSLDTTTYVTPPHSLKIVNTDGAGDIGAKICRPGIFKPNTRYRVSFFVKLDNVERFAPRGYSCWFNSYDGRKWHCEPAGDDYLQGTADWYYCEREFTTGDMKNAATEKSYIGFQIAAHVTGTAWFDDPILEELGPAASK